MEINLNVNNGLEVRASCIFDVPLEGISVGVLMKRLFRNKEGSETLLHIQKVIMGKWHLNVAPHQLQWSFLRLL